MTFSLVGAGSVGQSLASWFVGRGATLVQAAARPGSARLERFATVLGARALAPGELSSAGQDLLLLAVPDGELGPVARALSARPQAQVALHVSGAAAVAILEPLRAAGSAIGAFHPLRAFPAPETRAEEAAGVFFALGGDPAAIAVGRRLADALAGRSAVVAEEQRPLYHLVASLMAGGVVTVVAAAMEIATRAGLPPEIRPGFARLATDALAKALALPDPATGITGPAARGDEATLVHELLALEREAPEALAIVVALASESLRQRSRLADPDPPRSALLDLLARPDLLDLMKDRVLTSSRKPQG
jgi:predicted short-subunit dehydrogenase-like oxidoreductase (DUF2520 family)